ncbi:MAG: tyrosine recombinase XerC [Clostridiales bacterium]|nr:tyrosine recombinase XerC [Clostridiales bacterium]
MDNIKYAPEPLKSFLIYLESIQGKSAKTVDEYFYDIRNFYRFLNLKFGFVGENTEFNKIEIDNVDIDMLKKVDLNLLYEYANFLNRNLGNKARTRARKISALKSYFKYLHSKVKLIDENPTIDLDTVKIEKQLPKHFTLEDSINLLEAVDERNYERDYCILTLFLNCGMRLAELVSINITDIQGDKLVVVGKGNKERTIYLNQACIDAIEAYMPVRNKMTPEYKDKNALFLSERNNRISRRTVQHTVEKYVKKLGMDSHKYTTHKLRHTAATLMHQSGVDIRILQEILGHKQLSTTEIYTHINNEEIRAAVSKNPLNTPQNKK